jgi:hypothetical protein
MKGKGEMLNSSRQKTLEEIFEDPVRSDVQWNKIESLIVALGGDVKEGRGSRVRFPQWRSCDLPPPSPRKSNRQRNAQIG